MRGTFIAAAIVSVLAGCSTYDSLTQRVAQSITPYRITVVQGNFVSAETAAQLKAGMSRTEVRQLLGTPLLTDMFHADRWDYVFYFKRGSTNVVQQRDLTLLFSGDRLASWTGGEDLPSNLELLAEIDGDKAGKKAKPTTLASAPAAASAPLAAASATAPAQPAGGASGAVDANAEAAQAANRLTNAVQAPTGKITSSARASTPTANGGGVPPGATTAGKPQIQIQRPAPPVIQGEPQDNPVGPTPASSPSSSNGNTSGTQSSSNGGPTHNAPLTSNPTTSGTGG
ncbi:outer membrane protein assembly factor BamE [Paraburkholderia sp.]|uniref:outer membrane protein assembly factor BamE n=1 Tax=Paraburkholderia sp. TaxID=1926495 RepID=UPI002397CC63|nr:outer membrane protein assembly factor BamE [Paraburkholderia sp.]MDE1183293.1 outer membrane protein assembly factor BamE [Paraburkholderia sp.]